MSDVDNDRPVISNDQLPVYNGVVIWFQGSYGFIEWDKNGVKQSDIFVYWTDLSGMEGKYKTLLKDQRVQFNVGKNNRGQDKATNVLVLQN